MGNRHGRFSDHRHRQNPNPTIPPYQFGPTSQFGNLAPKHSTPITANSNMGLCLPYGHVDSSLRALAGQAEGFGRFAVGGLNGAVYRVITLADDGPGSLRDGCRKKEPLWIIFEVSGRDITDSRATPPQAIFQQVKRAPVIAFSPVAEISLPGATTDLIMGGASPIAIQLQIMVMNVLIKGFKRQQLHVDVTLSALVPHQSTPVGILSGLK